MNYAPDTLLTGQVKNITIMSSNRKYYIHIGIYKAALIDCPSFVEEFGHHIELNTYNTDEDIKQIIYFMHCAALPNDLIPRKYEHLDINNMSSLVNQLGIIGWCDSMIKTSRSYDNFKGATIESIIHAIDIVRSIVSSNNDSVGGTKNRLRYLSECKLPIVVPSYITEWILLPCLPSNDTSKNEKDWKIATLDRMETLKNNKFRVTNFEFTTDDKRYVCCGSHINKIIYDKAVSTYTMDDIIKIQDQLLSDFMRREARILCYEHPDYLKLREYNSYCTDVIHSLFKNDDLLLHCDSKPKMTICDVFQYGLAAALTADYE